MGTSASSKGPGSGVPMVPPWVPAAAPTPPTPPLEEEGVNISAGAGAVSGTSDLDQSKSVTVPLPLVPLIAPVAPPRRFNSARSNLGNFAHTGDTAAMRRGIGQYFRSGYGGGSRAVARFGGTASTANAIYGALSNFAAGHPAVPGSQLNPVLLAGRSAREVVDAVVEAVRPADGTQDAEAERASAKDALSELLTQFPDADLLSLSEEQRELVTERFVAIDVFRRVQLDLGKTIQDKAPTAAAGLARLKEVKDYVKETVASAFRKLKTAGTRITKGSVNQVVCAALLDAFAVFEGYMV